MSDSQLQGFQRLVSELLLRHRSLLDVMTKFSQSPASVNRTVAKAVTECGCIELNAQKQDFVKAEGLDEAKRLSASHLSGRLCEHCREFIRSEMGKHLFYLAAIGNLLDIRLDEVVDDERKKCSTLGLFNLT